MKTIRRPVVGPTGEYLEIGDTVLGIIQIKSTSLELKTDRDERVAHSFYQKLLNTISYPVYLHSRQRTTSLERYLDSFNPVPGLEARQEDYYSYCYEIFADGVGVTDHFLVVRAGPQSGSQTAVETLQTRLKALLTQLNVTDFQADHVTGDGLHRFVDRELNQDPKVSPEYSTVPSEDSTEYRKTIYIDEFPSTVKFDWPTDLLNLDGLVDITQVIRPQDIGSATERLDRLADWLEIEILSFLARGLHGFDKLERLVDDADWFRDRLTYHESRAHEYGVYITVHGPTKAAVENTYNRVDTQLRLLRIKTGSTQFRTDQAYYTDSPFHKDRLDQVSLMPTESVAAGFPFGTRPLTQSGVVYGIDDTENTPVLLDRFSWDSHSMAVMGTLGSGKSYWTQLELLRAACVYPDLRIIVIDPKIEYHHTIEALGGLTQIIHRGLIYDLEEKITCFQPKERGVLDHEDSLVELLEQIYTAVSKNRDKTIVVVDEANRLLTHPRGRRLLNQFVLEARDINTAVQVVSQSASHFTDRREGRDILNNVPATTFFRHEDISQSMEEFFDLSGTEVGKIRELPTGNDVGYSKALLHILGQERIHLHIDATQEEHQIIEDEETEEPERSSSIELTKETSVSQPNVRPSDLVMADREYFERSVNRLRTDRVNQ